MVCVVSDKYTYDWLGIKPGDLLETKEPASLLRHRGYTLLIAGEELYSYDAYGDVAAPYPLFFHMSLPDDHPWILKANENGWKNNRAELERLVALVQSVYWDDEYLTIGVSLAGETLLLDGGAEYSVDDLEAHPQKFMAEWDWRLKQPA